MTKTEISLLEAIVSIKDSKTLDNFFCDILTPAEYRSLRERWKVCQLLHHGHISYREIHKQTKASLTTIGRVARFLKEEKYGGYRTILDKLE